VRRTRANAFKQGVVSPIAVLNAVWRAQKVQREEQRAWQEDHQMSTNDGDCSA
jgi:hypothetical protein